MSIDADQFRTDFPEFSDTQKYPDGVITFWIGVAVISLPEDRWDTLYNVGLELFTAHHVVLAARDAAGRPGEVSGPATAKAVDKVSKSMDAQSVTLADGGFWNATSYGVRFLQMARMIGSGGIQVGAPCQ